VDKEIKSDSQLIEETLRGSLFSFEVVVKKYQTMINAYAYQILRDPDLSEDATQETFIKLYENLRKFDLKRPLKPWLYKIAKNTSYDIIRKNKKSVILDWDIESNKENVMDDIIRKENKDRVRRAVVRLPDKYKKPIMGYYFEELSYITLSKKLKLPINTLRTRLRRGKMELAKILEE